MRTSAAHGSLANRTGYIPRLRCYIDATGGRGARAVGKVLGCRALNEGANADCGAAYSVLPCLRGRRSTSLTPLRSNPAHVRVPGSRLCVRIGAGRHCNR